jgi:hypothetical protein
MRQTERFRSKAGEFVITASQAHSIARFVSLIALQLDDCPCLRSLVVLACKNVALQWVDCYSLHRFIKYHLPQRLVAKYTIQTFAESVDYSL